MTPRKKPDVKDDRISVVVKLTREQHRRLARLGEERGLQIGPLMRTLALAVAAETET